MQILPDAPLLPRAHIQQGPLKVVALGNIDSRRNDAERVPFACRQRHTGPRNESRRTHAASPSGSGIRAPEQSAI